MKTTLAELKRQFHNVLQNAQQLRPQKQQLIGSEPEWVIYERGVMLWAVNAVRCQNTLPLITIEEIKIEENLAFGHSDYSLKFALYCAELASDRR